MTTTSDIHRFGATWLHHSKLCSLWGEEENVVPVNTSSLSFNKIRTAIVVSLDFLNANSNLEIHVCKLLAFKSDIGISNAPNAK